MMTRILNHTIWLLIAGLYSPIFYQLYRSRWENIDYTHAYFILPVSLWLVWRERARLKELSHSPNSKLPTPLRAYRPVGPEANLFLIAISLLIFIFGWRQDYLFISTLSLIPLLFVLTIYMYGPAVGKALTFPILYLLLLVPPPLGVLDSITIPMRYGVSVATEYILHLFNYPITRDGLLLSLGGHEVYMGAPCSGFRSLVTMISLGLAYAYVIKGEARTRLALIISIVPLALIGNLLRVVGICLVTFYFGDVAGQKFHDVSGFVIFIVLIAGLIGIEALMERFKR